MDLESVRKILVRLEDTIIFSLIERANHPLNSPLYGAAPYSEALPSLFSSFLKESEALQAKAGRYDSTEDVPFFPDVLPETTKTTTRSSPTTPFLHPSGANVSVNDEILRFYLEKILPLIAVEGDGTNYAAIASADLTCLQALSRRIHYGKFVAEVKFRDAAEDYTPAIQSKDREGLMNLLTFESVEEGIKKRVEEKASIFGGESTTGKTRIDPGVVSEVVYGEMVIPLTKLVQVEYLLHRL
ncbi:hypothetical protein M569_01467, partial [Genlisea aurea]